MTHGSASGAGPPFRAGSVAILGWTNVGKSTLLNRLVQTKLAAVADVAQTTRQRIRAVRWVPGRGQVVFIDTPGLHQPRYRMNRKMVEAARQSLVGVDLALLLADAERGWGAGDEQAADWLRRSAVPSLLVLNKTDRIRRKARLLPLMAQLADRGFDEIFPISAKTGEGCDELLEGILAHLPESEPLFAEDYLTDQAERSLAAEWIREKLLAETREELPHATAVLIDEWRQRDDGLVEIEALVVVDKESQKGIVIGKNGELLKRVGSAARVELEDLLGRRVFLRLWVKVRADWRNDPAMLRRLGLD
jgi:GTP-binding protein Era